MYIRKVSNADQISNRLWSRSWQRDAIDADTSHAARVLRIKTLWGCQNEKHAGPAGRRKTHNAESNQTGLLCVVKEPKQRENAETAEKRNPMAGREAQRGKTSERCQVENMKEESFPIKMTSRYPSPIASQSPKDPKHFRSPDDPEQ